MNNSMPINFTSKMKLTNSLKRTNYWCSFKKKQITWISWLVKKLCQTASVISDSLQPHGLYIVHGILQARILEWVAFPFSRGCSQSKDHTGLPHCRWILYQPQDDEKVKWLSEEILQTAEKRELKGKRKKERKIHLNAELQRIARRDKKAF